MENIAAIPGPRNFALQRAGARHAVALAEVARDGPGSLFDWLHGAWALPIRLKKLVGTILLVALVIVYAIVATIIAVSQLSASGPLAHFFFFLLSGLLWVLPAMAIIKWTMVPGPDPRRDPFEP